MAVSLIFYSEFGIHDFCLRFRSVHFLALVDQVLNQFSTFEVNLDSPPLIAVKEVVDELQARDLGWLLAKQLLFGTKLRAVED